MQPLMTSDEVGKILRMDTTGVTLLVDQGRLGAFRVGDTLRFSESQVTQFLRTCEVAKSEHEPAVSEDERTVASVRQTDTTDRKWCKTFGGQSEFPYTGSVETGTSIWPGKNVHFRLKFTSQQWSDLLVAFRGRGEVRAGLNFAHPEPGSMGEWIKQNWNTKMGPASYVGGILIAEGYAERPRRGRIRFFDKRTPI